ncbi:MAG TPA: hypothetical protein VFH30_09445 [Acidimicrobiales bacterium]|jgi:hypothetical protein|nr:hypothetical protein [Acidimicrobiales bacterium]
MRRMTLAVAVLVVGAFGAACGDDGGGGSGGESSSAEGQEYVDAIVASNDESDLTDEQNECFARAFVDAVGVDQLQGAVSPDEIRENPESSPGEFGITLDGDQADALWEDVNECMDVRAAFVEGLTQGEDMSQETVDCLEDAIDDDLLQRVLVTSLMEGEEALQEDEELTSDLIGALSDCPGAVTEG